MVCQQMIKSRTQSITGDCAALAVSIIIKNAREFRVSALILIITSPKLNYSSSKSSGGRRGDQSSSVVASSSSIPLPFLS
jgi:hypothetical protein